MKICGHDAIPFMTAEQMAAYERENSRNGMSKGGNHRVIGEIPADLYFAAMQACNAKGEEFTTAELRKLLNKHPQYRAVASIDSGSTRNAQIQVKI